MSLFKIKRIQVRGSRLVPEARFWVVNLPLFQIQQQPKDGQRWEREPGIKEPGNDRGYESFLARLSLPNLS